MKKIFKPTYLYVKTHNITGLKYFGKTSCKDPIKYKGSGLYWMRHIKKHGYDVTTVIIGCYHTLEELKKNAVEFSKKHNIVSSKEWANMRLEDGLIGGDTSNNFTDISRQKISLRHSGSKNPQAKLTDKEALEIYYSCDSPEELSKKFNIGVGQIFGIKRKIYYKNVTKNIETMPGKYRGKSRVRTLVPTDIVKFIYLKEESYSYFKEKFEVSATVVKNIKLKKSYKSITKDLGVAGSVKKYNLTNEDTVKIFYSQLTLQELSKIYNVHPETIRNIKKGVSRKFFKDEF
jgi:hypothetical protein